MDADFAHRNHPLALATAVQTRLQVYQQLRQQYPNASLTAELVSVQGEQFVVRAQVEIGGQTLATGLGAATQIEEAEDRARLRVLELLGLSPECSAPTQWEVQVVAQATPALAAPANDRALAAVSTPIAATPPAIAPELEPEIPAFDEVEAEPELPSEPRVTQTALPERDRPRPAQPAAVTAELPLLEQPPAPTASLSAVPTDWSEDLAEIEVELKRLMWSEAEEQAYLLQHFGKRSRALIADYDQLLLFLDHLRSLPTPGLSPKPTIALEPEPKAAPTVSLPPLPEPTVIPTPAPAIAPPVEQPNRSEAMELTSAAVKRLGWTNRQGSDHLRQTYGKASRQQLTTEELLDFLHYLHRLSPPPSSEAVPF